MSQRTIAAAFLLLLPLLAYIPALNGNYLWDDDHHVTQNKDLRDAAGLVRIWTRLGLANGGTPQYYPLTHTTFWIQYQLGGPAPFPYHLINVLLHGFSAILAWRILLRLKIPGAYLAAAVWAIHPVNVETVAWITERKNVLSGLFYLLAFRAYLKALNEDGEWKMEDGKNSSAPSSILHLPSSYILSLLFFLLALLSKTTVSVMPATLFLILWWKRELTLQRVLGLLPFLIAGAVLGLLTATVERRYVGAVGSDWDLSFAQRILIAARAAWFYAGKLVWPHHLSFSYRRWRVDATSPRQWLYPAAVFAVIAATFHKPAFRTAVLSFLILLFPAMGFFNIYPMRYSFVADHFQYLASLPMIALLIAFLSRYFSPPIGRIAAAALLIALFITTWARAEKFRDSITLWQDTIAKTPSSWMARNNLGMALIERAQQTGSPADPDDAYQLLTQTLAIRPDHEWAHFGLGKIDEMRGNLPEAQAEFEQQSRISPDYAPTYFELGMIAMDENNWPNATRMFEQSRELDSKPPQGRNIPVKSAQTRLMLARLYTAAGRTADAQRMLAEAKQITTLDHPRVAVAPQGD